MGLFTFLGLPASGVVDWSMTPEYTFGTFESWGGKERIRSGRERIYYFFIDNWGEDPRLCLMERGIKHARVVAEILAPRDMVERCVQRQGKTVYEKSMAIDSELKAWLIANVVDTEDTSKIVPLVEDVKEDGGVISIPARGADLPPVERISLPSDEEDVAEEDLIALARQWGFVEMEYNPGGSHVPALVDNGDGLTVSDRRTGLMWQRGGTDIMSRRMLLKELEEANRQALAGYGDWRLPSLAEALSLMSREHNAGGLYIDPCFSADQPFIFSSARRRPGGYWFVDYKQGRAFWSSGTIPGGFGRFCRQDPEL